MSRVGLVTALLPPVVGGTQMLVWRLFQGDPNLVVVSGMNETVAFAGDGYSPLAAPTLDLPYPRLRGYRYGLAPALGAFSGIWLAAALVRVTRFLKSQGVDHVVSIPNAGPFALLGILAAHRLRIPHTLYILDAWEEAAMGPIERAFVRLGLRFAARMPRSRLAVVSPALGGHYRSAFGFRDVTWIPNPAPLPTEPVTTSAKAEPFVLFTGTVKPFNITALRCVARSIRRCKVIEKFVLTGHSSAPADSQGQRANDDDYLESRHCSPAEVSSLQKRASVLLVATNVDDTSQTSLGYLPGRLPEYVSTRRPILLIGPQGSDAARAIRHWRLGSTTTTQDETTLAEMFDRLALQGTSPEELAAHHDHDLFLEVFSRQEARRRLLGEPSAPLSSAAATLAAEFEQSLL